MAWVYDRADLEVYEDDPALDGSIAINNDCDPKTGEPVHATGYLLAAAPELLAALRPFAADNVSPVSSCHRGISSVEECGRCSRILRARAAIAKAKGDE